MDSNLDATYILAESDRGKKIELQAGESITVVLTGNPSTGFDWTVAEMNPEILNLEERQFQPASPYVGSGGQVRLHFCAVGSGRTRLKLHYRRSWETEKRPLRTWYVTLQIQEED